VTESPHLVARQIRGVDHIAEEVTVTLSGASGKSCCLGQESNTGRAVGPMSAAPAPDKRMTVRIPVDRRAVDRMDDLLPGLEAPTGKSQ
jgi:hypothetical protein